MRNASFTLSPCIALHPSLKARPWPTRMQHVNDNEHVHACIVVHAAVHVVNGCALKCKPILVPFIVRVCLWLPGLRWQHNLRLEDSLEDANTHYS